MKPKLRVGWVKRLLAVLAVLAIPLSHWRISAGLHSFSQPTEVAYPEYKDFGPYTLYVVDRTLWWKVWERGQVCELRIVRRDDGPDGYGHIVEYVFGNRNSEPDYFARCVCSWEPHGVTLTEPAGNRVFIPALAFTGGR